MLRKSYSYHCYGNKYNSGQIPQSYSNGYYEGDIVEMVLHKTRNGTKLYFIVDGEHQGIAFDNIEENNPSQYRLAVATRAFGDSVTLISLFNHAKNS